MMIIGYKVEYAWWHYPDDKLAIPRKYAKTYQQARAIFREKINEHNYCVRIVPITSKEVQNETSFR